MINTTHITEVALTLFMMGLFGDAHPPPTPLVKICHTYPTAMKRRIFIPYLMKIKKTYRSRDTPFDFCWHQYFLPEISNFYYIKKYGYTLHFDTYFLIVLTFFEFSKVVLINIVAILMMSAKLAILDLLKLKIFWSKGYDVISFTHDVTNNIL